MFFLHCLFYQYYLLTFFFPFSSPESVVWARQIVVRSSADAAETTPILNHCPLVSIPGAKWCWAFYISFFFPSEFPRPNVHLTRIFWFPELFTVDDF